VENFIDELEGPGVAGTYFQFSTVLEHTPIYIRVSCNRSPLDCDPSSRGWILRNLECQSGNERRNEDSEKAVRRKFTMSTTRRFQDLTNLSILNILITDY